MATCVCGNLLPSLSLSLLSAPMPPPTYINLLSSPPPFGSFGFLAGFAFLFMHGVTSGQQDMGGQLPGPTAPLANTPLTLHGVPRSLALPFTTSGTFEPHSLPFLPLPLPARLQNYTHCLLPYPSHTPHTPCLPTTFLLPLLLTFVCWQALHLEEGQEKSLQVRWVEGRLLLGLPPFLPLYCVAALLPRTPHAWVVVAWNLHTTMPLIQVALRFYMPTTTHLPCELTLPAFLPLAVISQEEEFWCSEGRAKQNSCMGLGVIFCASVLLPPAPLHTCGGTETDSFADYSRWPAFSYLSFPL